MPHTVPNRPTYGDRPDRSQERQVGFDFVHFALETGAHGAARAVHQSAGVGDAAFAQFLIFAQTAGEYAFHRTGVACIFGRRGKQVVEAGAGPELTLEGLVECLDAFERKQFAKDCGPARYRYNDQQQHDQLNHETGV